MSAFAVGPVGVVVDEPIEEFEQLGHLGWWRVFERMMVDKAEDKKEVER